MPCRLLCFGRLQDHQQRSALRAQVIQQSAGPEEARIEARVLLRLARQQQCQIVLHPVPLRRAAIGEVEVPDEDRYGIVVCERRQHLPCRQHRHQGDCSGRALVAGVEKPERLHLVAPELDSNRLRKPRRMNVDDAAPAAGLAWPLHGGHEVVTHPRPALQQRFQLQTLALLDGVGQRVQEPGGDGPLHQRHGRRYHQRWTLGRMLSQHSQRAQPLVYRRGVQQQALVREHLGLGEVLDRRLLAAVGDELLRHAPRVLGTGAHDYHGPAELGPKRAQHVGLGRFGQGDDPRVAGRQVSGQPFVRGHTLKGVKKAAQTHSFACSL